MSNFLTRLAERQVGWQKGVKPRLPSVFDPPSRALFEPPPSEPEFGRSDSSRAPELSVMERRDERRSLTATRLEQGDRRSPVRSHEADRDPQPVPQVLVRETSRERVGPPAPVQRIETDDRADGRQFSADHGLRANGLPSPRGEPSLSGRDSLPVVPQANTNAGSHALPEADPPPRTVAAPHLPPPLVLPRTPAREERMLPHTSQAPAIDEDPVVKVTIGRVEIRAVTGTPPSGPDRRTPDRPRAMSLEKYLERRRGGRH